MGSRLLRAGFLAIVLALLVIALVDQGGKLWDQDDLLLSASAVEPGCPMPNAEDVFVIFLTSGSTGVPKGVMISHRATWLRAFAGSLASSTTGGGGALVAFPLFHMAGWFFAYQAWSAHQSAHLVRRADGRDLLETVERHRPASLYCIPAVWQRVLAEEGTYDTSSLEWTFTGTSRVAPAFLQSVRERFPAARMTVNYGSTEAGRALSLPDRDIERKPYSVGRPVPGFRVHIAGPSMWRAMRRP